LGLLYGIVSFKEGVLMGEEKHTCRANHYYINVAEGLHYKEEIIFLIRGNGH
jgi:hypothetical protein